MGERYIISIKVKKDNEGNDNERWMYANTGSRGTNYPCWYVYESACTHFDSVDEANTWFNDVKSILFDPNYNRYDFDMETLAIRKIIYKKVASLVESDNTEDSLKKKKIYNVGDRVVAKIHCDNDPRTQVTAIINDVISCFNDIMYVISFAPDDLGKSMGSVGCTGCIKHDQIIGLCKGGK